MIEKLSLKRRVNFACIGIVPVVGGAVAEVLNALCPAELLEVWPTQILVGPGS
ncbi:MAG: hypothetical protein WKF84_07490 [Pyrinomonadaceae bacterium]